MKFWPASLLGRTVLVTAFLLLASQLIMSQLFKSYIARQRVRNDAELVASQVYTLSTTISSVEPEDRARLIRRLKDAGLIADALPDGIRLADDPDTLKQVPVLEGYVKEILGLGTEVRHLDDHSSNLWIHTAINGQAMWVVIPWPRHPSQFLWKLFVPLLVTGLLSLVGGYLIVRRINRPLDRLSRAALAVGRAQMPEPVPEEGPLELRTLSHSFNHMLRGLSHLEQDRSLMLAGVSHDLRTPLSRLRLRAEMLGAMDPDKARDAMAADIDYIDRILNKFIDFARDESSETPVLANLNETVGAIARRYQEAQTPVALRMREVPDSVIRPLAIERLISNLVENAFRHGGGDVDIETDMEQGAIRVSVLDRGPGIDALDAERVKGAFTTLDSARAQRGGSGLGLAVADRIARLHDGRLSLLPRVGGGLEARIVIPVRIGRA